jgi:hypothetical protein
VKILVAFTNRKTRSISIYSRPGIHVPSTRPSADKKRQEQISTSIPEAKQEPHVGHQQNILSHRIQQHVSTNQFLLGLKKSRTCRPPTAMPSAMRVRKDARGGEK